MASAEEIQQGFQDAAKAVAGPKELMQRLVLIAEANAKKRSPVATGNLRRSITSRVETPQRGLIGTSVDYARYVHDGTRYMEGRPFLEQGLDDSQAQIRAELEKFGGKVLGEIGR